MPLCFNQNNFFDRNRLNVNFIMARKKSPFKTNYSPKFQWHSSLLFGKNATKERSQACLSLWFAWS
ncbi:TPA: hypothetical protein MFX25_19325 [Klebsiella pneumoniae]|nr:hypothetical protein CWN31_21630 [Klebsiella pneumoniae]HBX3803827.1 hypothetical protein [Klebsiella pneumoniae subsp. pneumoniae]PLM70434.1 hypothetical protein CWN23_18770 [Klebsiella pneumoniae]HBW9727832.1 hypothetical protein [Klebsiella pneumoniae]HBW9745082.1 hypothetical protein [Klebsiella pneumoniae]